MRISQDLARQVSVKVIASKYDYVEKLLKDFQAYVTAEYIRQTPKAVIELSQKYGGWFENVSSIRLHGHGFNYEYVTPTEKCITYNGEGYLEMSDKFAAKAKSLYNKWSDANKKTRELKKSIEVTLIGLRTFAQVQKHLPEAVEFLPKSTSMELTVNFDSLRKEINSKP